MPNELEAKRNSVINQLKYNFKQELSEDNEDRQGNRIEIKTFRVSDSKFKVKVTSP